MSDEDPVVNIIGERVALGPLRRDLIPVYHQWENDFFIHPTRGVTSKPMSLEQVTEWYDRQARDERSVWFTIYERATWRPIGFAWWDEINYRDGTAMYSIVIGEAECRGRGYGTETTRLMLDYAFTALGLHNVMLIVAEFNEAGLRAYRKAGFREIGRRRQSYVMGGRRWDDVYMECLATEFESTVLGSIFSPDQPRP